MQAYTADETFKYTQDMLTANPGMRGLFEAWRHTGEDELCDWTFTLDESSH